MDTLQVDALTPQAGYEEKNASTSRSEELTLIMTSVNEQKSAMSKKMKAQKRAESPGLDTLLEQTIQEKGEEKQLQKNWISETEVEIEGLSNMTMHSFLLEAEKLGKNITYTRTLKVKISD